MQSPRPGLLRAARALLAAVALALPAAAPAQPLAPQIPMVEPPGGQDEAPQEGAEKSGDEGAEPAPKTPPRPAARPGVEANLDSFDSSLAGWEETAGRAEALIVEGTASTPELEVLRETLAAQREAAQGVAERLRSAADPLRAQLEALGPPPEEGGVEEPPSVAADRHRLQARLEAVETRQRKAELARTRADTLVTRIDDMVRGRFVDRLMSLGPSPLNATLWPEAATALLDRTVQFWSEVGERIEDPVARRDRAARLPLLLFGLGLGSVLLVWGRRRAVHLIVARIEVEDGRGRRTALGALAALARLALPASAVGLIWLALQQSQLFGPLGSLWLDHLAWGALLMIGARAIGLTFYAPDAPGLRLSRLEGAKAATASRRALGLGLALLLNQTLVQAGERADLSAEALAVLNLAVLVVGAVSLWGLGRCMAPPAPLTPAPEPGEHEHLEDAPESLEGLSRTLAVIGALLMRASALGAVALAAWGYYAASQFAFYPLVMSLGVIAAGVLVYTLLREAVEGYLEGRTADSRGLRLLPVMVGFLISCLTLPVLALIWGARLTDLAEVWRLIVEGGEVGGVRISPAAFLTFVIVFALGYGATRLIQTVMAGSVLPNTRLDAGGRSAVTTGIGYAGFIIAALLGTAAAGLDLSSLAIVAGALSVGIGFGLQAIVNNFVSGIILLVERPIKVGDWIFVGGDHGIVKRVSVRATQIETFDKSMLFLPNSDLISGKVVNYTHQNNAGRLIIRVPVAYGSDPREVERILTQIAREETRILRYPAPLIMFAGFGDNGMLFEMRVILRDVNLIFNIQSDLYFEVERRLREAGIEIPMAQRALHIRDPRALGDAFRSGMPAASDEAGGTAPPSGAPRPPSGPADGEIAPGGGDPE